MELAGRLAAFLTTGAAGEGEYGELTGARRRRVGVAADPGVAAAVAAGDLRASARLWLTGAVVPWRELHGARPPRRVSLPTYPFGRKEYWYGDGKPSPAEYGPRREGRPEQERRPQPEQKPEPARRRSRCPGAERNARWPHAAPAAAPDAREWLRRAIGEQLDTRPHHVRTDQDFPALGLSSMALVHLARRIQREIDPEFESASLFAYTTVDQLAAHLGDGPRAHAPEPAVTPAPSPLPDGSPPPRESPPLRGPAGPVGPPEGGARGEPRTTCRCASGPPGSTPALCAAPSSTWSSADPVLGGVVREEHGRLVLARPDAPAPPSRSGDCPLSTTTRRSRCCAGMPRNRSTWTTGRSARSPCSVPRATSPGYS